MLRSWTYVGDTPWDCSLLFLAYLFSSASNLFLFFFFFVNFRNRLSTSFRLRSLRNTVSFFYIAIRTIRSFLRTRFSSIVVEIRSFVSYSLVSLSAMDKIRKNCLLHVYHERQTSYRSFEHLRTTYLSNLFLLSWIKIFFALSKNIFYFFTFEKLLRRR